MQISPALLGFVRGLGSVVVWALVTAVLSYCSDATHFAGWLNDGLAALVAAVALSIEHNIENQSGTALFGMARRKGY